MQDHSQQTHKVFVPDLPGMEGIRVKEVPALPGQGWAIPPWGTHVMAAVSARKAWAVTSHLMFFTATLCPMYSPCRTSGRAWESQAEPHTWSPAPQAEPPMP